MLDWWELESFVGQRISLAFARPAQAGYHARLSRGVGAAKSQRAQSGKLNASGIFFGMARGGSFSQVDMVMASQNQPPASRNWRSLIAADALERWLLRTRQSDPFAAPA